MERAKMMPMSSPGWFDDFPEYLTEADYRDLSEEISRTIEVVHGHIIKCESPPPGTTGLPVAWRTPWKLRDHPPVRA
jgi:hypothetical protein